MKQSSLRAAALPAYAAEYAALSDARLFRAHFERLPGPAYLWSRHGAEFVLIAHNRAAVEVPLSRITELLGITARELFAHQPFLLDDLEEAARSGIAQARETEFHYTTGLVRMVALTYIPLARDLVVIHTLDVTERYEAEKALRESERRYRTIVDTAHEGIWVSDAEGVTTFVNRHAAELLGYEPEQMIGKPVFEFVPEDMIEEAEQIRSRRNAGAKDQFDFKLKHRDGSTIWVSVAGAPIFDVEGRYAGAISMISDITERRSQEVALRDSEARVRVLLDAIPDMVMRVDRAGRHLDVYASEVAHPTLPYLPDQIIGRTCAELFDEEFAAEHQRRVLAALESGRTEVWEYEFDFSGSTRHMEARFTRISTDEVVVTCRDNTERIDLEREVIAIGERERNRIGHDLHDGLAQLLTGVKLLLASLSEKLERGGLPYGADAREATELVQLAIRQTSELARGLSPIPKGAKLHDGLMQLAEQSRSFFAVDCRYAGSKRLPVLSEEACAHLYRIAQEAVTNAVRHGRARKITIDCNVHDTRIVLTVADDGMGLPEQPAARGGMGLSIMLFRANSLGGTLAIEPGEESGTVVRCVCPLAPHRV